MNEMVGIEDKEHELENLATSHVYKQINRFLLLSVTNVIEIPSVPGQAHVRPNKSPS